MERLFREGHAQEAPVVSGERQPVTPSPVGEPQRRGDTTASTRGPLKWLWRRKTLQSSSDLLRPPRSSRQRCTHSVFSATFRVLSLPSYMLCPSSEASPSLFKTFQNPGRRASLVVPTVHSLDCLPSRADWQLVGGMPFLTKGRLTRRTSYRQCTNPKRYGPAAALPSPS